MPVDCRMRTIEEFRNHQMEMLAMALTRPAFFCGRDSHADLVFGRALGDLCWIDEREREWRRVSEKFIYGPNAVIGQLRRQPICLPEYLNECTSIYAELAWGLGYFQVERLLTLAEWTALRNSLNTEFFNREWLASEIEERFGPPSHRLGGGSTTVAVYACEDRAVPWIFLDFARRPPASEEWYPDERLRDVRIDRCRFQLLEWANWCRRHAAYYYPPNGREPGFLNIGMVSIEGDQLNSVAPLLGEAGYVVKETFVVEEGSSVAKELTWRPGPGQIAIAAFLDNGWTHIIDSDNGLMLNDRLLTLSEVQNTRIFTWHCNCTSVGYSLVSRGSRLRDVLYSGGGVVVDRGRPLPEESNLDWSKAGEEDVRAIAARFGAPYDFLADRKYLVFRVDQPEEVRWR